jgi:hypothetical protein
MRKRADRSARPIKSEAAAGYVKRTPDELARFKNTVYGFWRACAPRCQRAKACTGEQPQKCFDRFWAATPESHKEYIRALIRARAAGANPADSTKAAEAALAACLAREADEASATAPAPTPPSDQRAQATSQPPMPRARVL